MACCVYSPHTSLAMDWTSAILATAVFGGGGELVAFLGGGEAALGGQAQAVERNVLGGFLDAGLMVSGSSRSGFLEVIRPSTTFLSPETSASGAKSPERSSSNSR